MKLEMRIYRGQKADFYIQNKGFHAGRPLKKPIRNCFAVWTDKEQGYEIITCLYLSKMFHYHILGTAIPYVRLSEVRKMIFKEFNKNYCKKSLRYVQAAIKLHETVALQAEKSKMLVQAYAKNAIRDAYENKN